MPPLSLCFNRVCLLVVVAYERKWRYISSHFGKCLHHVDEININKKLVQRLLMIDDWMTDIQSLSESGKDKKTALRFPSFFLSVFPFFSSACTQLLSLVSSFSSSVFLLYN